MVQRALEAADVLAAEGIEAEIIDPRTIMPLDIDTIVASVRKTHRLLIVDEAWAMCGLGGEIAQAINELAFDELDAPPGRLHTAPTSHPFAPVLERAMLVDTARIVQGVRDVIAGKPPGARSLVHVSASKVLRQPNQRLLRPSRLRLPSPHRSSPQTATTSR